MSDITKLEFAALDISGKNYLSWILDAEIHLDAINFGNTIKEGNTTSLQDRAEALIFFRHHIDEGLLLNDHQSRPTGSIPLPEAKATIQVNRRGRGRGHGQSRGRGRGRYNDWNRGNYNRLKTRTIPPTIRS